MLNFYPALNTPRAPRPLTKGVSAADLLTVKGATPRQSTAIMGRMYEMHLTGTLPPAAHW
jgi:hypothetical protein